MPLLPPRACDTPGCKNTAEPGGWLCKDHKNCAAQAYDKRRQGTAARKLYNNAAWRKLRAALIARNPICQVIHENGQQCTKPSHVGHHIRDHAGSTKLFYDWGNLAAICDACHASEPAAMACKAFTPTIDALGYTHQHGQPQPKPFSAAAQAAPRFYVSGLSENEKASAKPFPRPSWLDAAPK